MNTKQLAKNAGMADIAFIGIILAGVWIAGVITPIITKKADSPIEQLAEKIIHMESGQEVDFSAHLKKDEDGKVSVTQAKAVTTNPPKAYVIPPTYGK